MFNGTAKTRDSNIGILVLKSLWKILVYNFIFKLRSDQRKSERKSETVLWCLLFITARKRSLVQWGAWSGGGCGNLPCDGYCCGRYASYWNAFLFFDLLLWFFWSFSLSLLFSLGVNRSLPFRVFVQVGRSPHWKLVWQMMVPPPLYPGLHVYVMAVNIVYG